MNSPEQKAALIDVIKDRIAHEHFLHLLLLVVIGAILYLSHVGKPEVIPSVIEVGAYSVGVTVLGIAGRWVGSRVDMVADSIPQMTRNYNELTEHHRKIKSSVSDVADSIGVLASDIHQNRSMVLLAEDNPIDARLVTSACVEVIQRYRVSLRVVSSMRDAIALVHRSCLSIIDVALDDSNCVARVNNLIAMASPWPVIVYTHGDYEDKDFPNAVAVVNKTATMRDMVELIGDTLAKTRF